MYERAILNGCMKMFSDVCTQLKNIFNENTEVIIN